MKRDVLGFNNEKKGEVTLAKALSDNIDVSGSIYYKCINENANIHIGTAFKKNRSLVKGGGAKPWKQKGTGRARAGTKSSPIFVGGGVAFGNQRKVYKFKLPSNLKKIGILSLFNVKFKQDLVTIIDNISIKTPRVKEFETLMKKLIKFGEKNIVIVVDIDSNLRKAVRNIKNIKLFSVKRLKVSSFLNDNKVFITKDAIEYLNKLNVKINLTKKSAKAETKK